MNLTLRQRHYEKWDPTTSTCYKSFDICITSNYVWRMFDLHFNAALKVINITMAYDNDENSITVCTTPLSAERGVESPTKFSERGRGLDRISIFRGGLLGWGMNFFSGRGLHKKLTKIWNI